MAAKINNVAYSWSMIRLNFSSALSTKYSILLDCTAISWNTERKVDSIYGLGGQPRKRGFGNVTYEASITLPYGAQVELRSYSSDGTLLGLGEFDINVTWVNDLAQNAISEAVTIAGCIFTQGGMDAKQDDTSLEKSFDLHPHRIYTDSSKQSKSWSNELYYD